MKLLSSHPLPSGADVDHVRPPSATVATGSHPLPSGGDVNQLRPPSGDGGYR